MTAIIKFFGGIGGKIAGALALIALAAGAYFGWRSRQRAEGKRQLEEAQEKKLAQERQKRDENEDDIRTMPDADLDAELRERRRP